MRSHRGVLAVVLLLTAATAVAEMPPPAMSAEGMVMVPSARKVEATVVELERAIRSRGLTIFATVDHAANARRAGLSLRPMTLLLFGNPEVGTSLLESSRTVGLDLPQRMLVWHDANGAVFVGYNDPSWLAERHGIVGHEEELAKMSALLEELSAAACSSEGS